MKQIIVLLSLIILVSAKGFAQEAPAITIHTTLPEGSTFTIGLHSRQPFAIDWGDGVRIEYEAGNYGIDALGGVVSGDGWIRLWCEVPESILSLYIGSDQRNQQVDSLDIASLKGLKFLYCQNNLLSSIDLSASLRLMELNVASNRISKLDLRNAPLLDMLVCQNNQLKALDLSPIQSLMALRCENNEISTLDLRHFDRLTVLHCEGNPLTELDISQNGALQQLFASATQISSWDLTPQTDLRVLDLSNTPASTINWGEKDELRQIYLNSCELSVLSLPSLPLLETLEVQDNQLTVLDLSGIPLLQDLRCNNNQLRELDLSPVEHLDYLFAEGNRLSQLDLSPIKGIKELLLSYNDLSSIDLSHCSELYLLWLSDNPIQELDIRTAPDLFSLFLDGCSLSDLTLGTLLSNLPDIHNIATNERTAWWKKWLLIKGNMLSDTVNASLASNKGWQVDLLDHWPGRDNSITIAPAEIDRCIIRVGERLELTPSSYDPRELSVYLYDMCGVLVATVGDLGALSEVRLGNRSEHYICISIIDGAVYRTIL